MCPPPPPGDMHILNDTASQVQRTNGTAIGNRERMPAEIRGSVPGPAIPAVPGQ